MEQGTLIKLYASGVGAMLASFILWAFQVPPEAFLAALICSVIGEFAKKTTEFRAAVVTIVAVTILTAYFGKLLIDHFNTVSPTSICGAMGFACTYYRERVLGYVVQILEAFRDWVISFFKRGG